MRLDRATYSTHKPCVHVWTALWMHTKYTYMLRWICRNMYEHVYKWSISRSCLPPQCPIIHLIRYVQYRSLTKECLPLKKCLLPTFGPICCIGFTQMSTPSGVSIVWLIKRTRGLLRAQPQAPWFLRKENFVLYFTEGCYKLGCLA